MQTARTGPAGKIRSVPVWLSTLKREFSVRLHFHSAKIVRLVNGRRFQMSAKPDPLVCAIMLTRDRPQMAARAVRSFRAQVYENKRIFILDTSVSDFEIYFDGHLQMSEFPYVTGATQPNSEECLWAPFDSGLTIGALRNYANQYAKSRTGADIFVHWDDDDWSHPNRIAEQVALLQQSGWDAVGYRDMLFWREPTRPALEVDAPPTEDYSGASYGAAWLYNGATPNYALGTSLCYWRRTWEQRPGWGTERDGLPRMIASIHAGNTSTGYDLERHVAMGSQQWKRVPTCDEYCRERMTR